MMIPFLLLVCSLFFPDLWHHTVMVSALDLPSPITFRAGVLHAPPFAILEEGHFGVKYDGYQLELLKRLVEFAAQDGVELAGKGWQRIGLNLDTRKFRHAGGSALVNAHSRSSSRFAPFTARRPPCQASTAGKPQSSNQA